MHSFYFILFFILRNPETDYLSQIVKVVVSNK